MDYEFKVFEAILHQTQPENSNWCWAACLSKLLMSFEINTSKEKSQCKIVEYYLNNYSINDDKQQITCCPYNENNVVCNKTLNERHLKCLFGDYNINCDEIDAENFKTNINDYDYIKSTLEENGAPILVQIKKNIGNSHLILISGFGKTGDCKYVFIGDPIQGEQYYQRLDAFAKTEGLHNAWVMNFESSKREKSWLIPDQIMLNRILNLKSRITKLNINHSLREEISNNAFVFFNEDNTSALDSISELNTIEKNNYFVEKLLFERNNCISQLERSAVEYKPIIGPDKFSDFDNVINKENTLYFPDYAMRVKIIRKENEELHYEVIRAPNNYNFKLGVLSHHELIEALSTKEKINYLN